jgi:hypothetical protein
MPVAVLGVVIPYQAAIEGVIKQNKREWEEATLGLQMCGQHISAYFALVLVPFSKTQRLPHALNASWIHRQQEVLRKVSLD